MPHSSKTLLDTGGGEESDGRELVPWFDPNHAASVAAAPAVSNTMSMDALVPCSNRTDEQSQQVMESNPAPGTCMVGCSTRVGSCSGAATQEEDAVLAVKHARAARVPVAREWSGRGKSVSGSAKFGKDSQHVTLDTCHEELSMGFTSTSMGSPENTVDDHDSVGHSGPPVKLLTSDYHLLL